MAAFEDLHVVPADLGDVDGRLAGACRQQRLVRRPDILHRRLPEPRQQAKQLIRSQPVHLPSLDVPQPTSMQASPGEPAQARLSP